MNARDITDQNNAGNLVGENASFYRAVGIVFDVLKGNSNSEPRFDREVLSLFIGDYGGARDLWAASGYLKNLCCKLEAAVVTTYGVLEVAATNSSEKVNLGRKPSENGSDVSVLLPII